MKKVLKILKWIIGIFIGLLVCFLGFITWETYTEHEENLQSCSDYTDINLAYETNFKDFEIKPVHIDYNPPKGLCYFYPPKKVFFVSNAMQKDSLETGEMRVPFLRIDANGKTTFRSYEKLTHTKGAFFSYTKNGEKFVLDMEEDNPTPKKATTIYTTDIEGIDPFYDVYNRYHYQEEDEEEYQEEGEPQEHNAPKQITLQEYEDTILEITYLFNEYLDKLAQKSSKKYIDREGCVIFTTEDTFTRINVTDDFVEFLLQDNRLLKEFEDYIPMASDLVSLEPNSGNYRVANHNIADITCVGRERILLEEHTAESVLYLDESTPPNDPKEQQMVKEYGEKYVKQFDGVLEEMDADFVEFIKRLPNEKFITLNEDPEIRVKRSYPQPKKEGFYNRFKNKLHRYLIEVFPIVSDEIHRERTAYLICYDVKIGDKEPLKLKAFSFDWDMRKDNFHILGLPEAYEGLSDVRFLYYNPSSTGGALNNRGYYLIAPKNGIE